MNKTTQELLQDIVATGLTKQQIADFLGVSYTAVHYYLTGSEPKRAKRLQIEKLWNDVTASPLPAPPSPPQDKILELEKRCSNLEGQLNVALPLLTKLIDRAQISITGDVKDVLPLTGQPHHL
jgi:hypothetical protein